jgi:thioredoxin reductase
MPYDVVIVGGGPAGLSAALALGRARKRVLLCDSGPRRNAAAVRVHNFVTRDGTPPNEFRAIARQQLTAYPSVEVRDAAVSAVSGAKGSFRVSLGADTVEGRRLVLCVGMLDEQLPVEGFSELWGHAIFQCPYCHGWEVRDRRWGYLGRPGDTAHVLPFVTQLRGWTGDVTLFTGLGLELPEETMRHLLAAGVKIETAAIARLVGKDGHISAVQLTDGRDIACDALFAHPPQRHVPLVRDLGLTLADDGTVQVDPMRRETSVPGIYAAGDLATRMQGALLAAAAGTQAAAMLNMELTLELAASGALSLAD